MPARPAVFIAYLRVSTAKQGAKGLGIEAQRAAVETFARQEGATIAAEYVEVETGKGHDALGSRLNQVHHRTMVAIATAAAKLAASLS